MSAEHFDFSDLEEDDINHISRERKDPAEGQYHFQIMNVDTSRSKVNGIEIELAVAAGTVADQENKTFKEVFWDPRDTDKDQGKFAKRRLARLINVTGLATPQEMMKPGFQFDPDALTYRCLKAAVKDRHSKKKDKAGVEREYVNTQIDGLNYWAPNDPEAAHIPVDAGILEICFSDVGQTNAVMPVVAEGSEHSAPAVPAKKTAQPAASTQPAPAQPAATAAKQGTLPGTAPAQKAADPYAAL